jgi:TPP-dependent pyruvate/acetoin dehydrogenase alpha subunit
MSSEIGGGNWPAGVKKMAGIAQQEEARPATDTELARIDFFDDLQDQYLSVHGLQARWHPKDLQDLDITRDTYLRLHFLMALTRAVEETIDSAFRSGHVPGAAFFGRGNEANSVGSAFCLRNDEWLVPMHRNCGSHLTKGGRDGNYHIGYRPKNITQLISHIGTTIPIAAGLAWAAKRRGPGHAVLTHIGDGGTSAGDFHEGLNFAAVHRLPLVVVIDNNQYAYKTPLPDQSACPVLALRAAGYGIPGFLIDGTDVLLVHEICNEALKRARAGEGPILIESITMRLRGHSVYDKYTDYVDMNNLQRWEAERDPISRYEQFLTDNEIASPEEIASSNANARTEADAARDEALKSPLPDPATVTDGVYAD